MKRTVGATTVETQQGDITLLEVDAIVNPANAALKLGGGVAGAIARRGGPQIQRECNAIGGTPVGTAVVTSGGDLEARYVVHAVGPRWGEGDEERKLASATAGALRVAESKGARSIALPAISTGIFGYPLDQAARVIVGAVGQYLSAGRSKLDHVVLCLFDDTSMRAFEWELEHQFEVSKS